LLHNSNSETIGDLEKKVGEKCASAVINPITPELESVGYNFVADTMGQA